MLLSSYNHEPLSGDCFEDSQALNQQGEMLPSSGPLANCSMQDHASLKPTDQGSACTPTRALRMKPQPNQVLKCPRCNSLNTKFCYYNNYSLTQPRHFCKNCRRYWTKGGALRNVPVGGGCRKNKRAKQKNSDQPSNGASADKTMSGSFSNETLSSRHGQLLAAGCSTSSLYDLAKDEDGIGLPYSRIPHAMRLADHSGTSNGLSFEIPRGPSQPPGVSFSSLPISLSAFDTGLSAAGTLNFQGLMKQENGGGGMNNGGEFTSMYDPSLNLLGPASAGSLSEGLSTFNIGLESFVGLGLNGDLKWRQQQQQSKIATLVEHEQNQDAAIHHHHQSLLHLEDADSMRQQTKGKSSLVGMSSQDQVHEQVSHGSSDWQGQQEAFLEPSGEATYWNTPAWPLDLPIYVDQQYSDVKPVEQAVSDFYHRAATMNRCTPSLT